MKQRIDEVLKSMSLHIFCACGREFNWFSDLREHQRYCQEHRRRACNQGTGSHCQSTRERSTMTTEKCEDCEVTEAELQRVTEERDEVVERLVRRDLNR